MLPSDHDSPVLLRMRRAMVGKLPAISDIAKLGLVHLQALLARFREMDQDGHGLEEDTFVATFGEVCMVRERGPKSFMTPCQRSCRDA